jgi:hypothetical protein
MKVIRYGLHFAMLAVAAVIFLRLRNLYPRFTGSDFDFFHFGLMGALHATCVVASLRQYRAPCSSVAFPLYALSFVTLVTVMGAVTPILGLWGTIIWTPLGDAFAAKVGPALIFITASTIGASGYWLLVRFFWMRTLRRRDWLRTVSLCVTATLLAIYFLERVGGYKRGVSKLDQTLFYPILTVAWWFAFSISLYWSEATVANRLNAGGSS